MESNGENNTSFSAALRGNCGFAMTHSSVAGTTAANCARLLIGNYTSVATMT